MIRSRQIGNLARFNADGTGLVGLDGGNVPIQRYGSRLAVFGDSRFAIGYPSFTPSALSLSGQTATITATGIGARFVGEEVIIGRSNGVDYMRAGIATVVDADNITATVSYPVSGLPSGSVVTAGSMVIMRDNRPSMCSSYATWILALLGQPFEQVRFYGYNGCRVEGGFEYQIKDAMAQGFDAAWVHLCANNYLSTLDNQEPSVITAKLDHMIDAMQGRPVWFFLEPPLSGTYYSATHKERIIAINAWARAKTNVRVVDLYTPIDDGTGTAKTNYLHDGLHPSIKGALNAALYVYRSIGISSVNRSVTTLNAGSARYPLTNPTMSGTLGANLPTGYTKGVSGSVTELSYTLSSKADGSGNEFSVVVVATGSGSHYLRCASTAVTAGGKYRCRVKLSVIDGAGVDYPEITMRNQTGDTLIQNILYASNISGNGSADGSYTIWAELDVIIPAAVTNVYLRPRIFFDSAGGATITYSDFQMERIS